MKEHRESPFNLKVSDSQSQRLSVGGKMRYDSNGDDLVLGIILYVLAYCQIN